MTIKAVIFDLDNTLLNRRETFKIYVNKFISEYVVVADDDDKHKVINYIIKADMDGYRKKKELYLDLLTTLQMKRRDTTIDELLEFWSSEFSKCSVPMDGAITILQYLKSKNIKLGLITNGSARGQSAKIDQVNIRCYFDSTIISDDVGVKKPDKSIFEKSLQALQVSADHAIFVGDQPINDVIGAENAGIKAVWLTGYSEWNISEKQPRYSISTLTELKDLFDRISAESRDF